MDIEQLVKYKYNSHISSLVKHLFKSSIFKSSCLIDIELWEFLI